MPTPPSAIASFFSQTRSRASEYGLTVYDLGREQGLLLFDSGTSTAEKLLLLQNIQHTLSATPHATGQPSAGYNNHLSPACHCQVTVEERAQLFAFLDNRNP